MNKKTLLTVMVTGGLLFSNVAPVFQPVIINAAPPPPTTPASSPTPTPPPVEPPVRGESLRSPPSPDSLPPEVEQARARQAIEAVLKKHLTYWGPRYQVEPVEVAVEGEWAVGVSQWKSEAKTLSGPVYVLAHRLPDGTWQALMPSGEGLYLQWLETMPERLVSAGEKGRLRVQVTESAGLLHSLHPLAASLAETPATPIGEQSAGLEESQALILDVQKGKSLIALLPRRELATTSIQGDIKHLGIIALSAKFSISGDIFVIDDSLALRRINATGTSTLLPPDSANAPLFVSPDGKYLAYLKPKDFLNGPIPHTNGVAVMNLVDGREQVVFEIPYLTVHLYGWAGNALVVEVPYWSPTTFLPSDEMVLGLLPATGRSTWIGAFASLPRLLPDSEYPRTSFDQKYIAYETDNGVIVASLQDPIYSHIADGKRPVWIESGLTVVRNNVSVSLSLPELVWMKSNTRSDRLPLPSTQLQIPSTTTQTSVTYPMSIAAVLLHRPVASNTPISAYRDLDRTCGSIRDWLGHAWTVTCGESGFRYGWSYDQHEGTDYDGDTGDPIYASQTGTVVNVSIDCANTWSSGIRSYGTNIRIDHGTLSDGNGYATGYAHLKCDSVNVRKDDRIATLPRQIAQMGNTGYSSGPHLHLNVHRNGSLIDPYDEGIIGDLNCAQSGGVVLFWNANKGCSNDQSDAGYRQFTSPGVYYNFGAFNDKASSAIVPSGWSVRISNDWDGTDGSICLNSYTADFGTLGNYPGTGTAINDSVSRAEVFDNNNCDPGPQYPVTLFENPGYDGARCWLTGEGWANACPGFNDKASSIRIQSGWSARVYEHNDRGESSRCFNGDDPRFSDDTFENGSPLDSPDGSVGYVSSFEAYPQSNCPSRDTTPPTGQITAPTSGTIVRACPLTIQAQANDSQSGVNRVGFYVYYDGNWHPLGEDSTAPYTWNWDCSVVANDQETRTTIHIWDNAGNEAVDPGGYVYVTLDRKPDPPSLVYPTSGVTFPRGTNITLDWNSSARATEYAVRLGGVSHPTITVSAGAATELNIGPVDPDAYSWQVQARNQYGATWSDIWNFTIRENIPAAPSILTVTAVSQTQINVTWRDNSNNEDGFYIYRYRDRETPAVIASVPANAVGYANVGLPCGTDYWYYVSAYNEAGENPSGSRRTATYPCTPELTLPTNGSTIDDSTPSFAWNQAGYFHEQYQIQVDDFPSFISPVISQTISTQGYTAASPLSDGTWYWRVRTYGWSNWSPWSSTWQFTISTAVSAQVEYVSRHIVQPGQVFSPTISVRVNSGYLDPVRGDDLRHTDGNTFGASTPQPIRYYVPSGSTYVFDTNNDPSFAMTAPSTEGLYTSIWRVWANGSYASGDAAIHLTVDGTPPDVRITSPTDGGALNANSIAIEVSASDARSGMNLIQFFLGYDDGTGWNWHVLGWDTDGSDGWSMTWNAITVTDQFVRYQVYGWDNAWNGTWHWVDSALDRTAPSSAVNPLNPTQSSTSFVVTWSGSDNLSGITSYDVQYRDGAGGIWTDWITGTTLTSAIFNGQHSRTYFFRSRALDRAGNQEPYPTGDGDTYTTINSPESVPYFYSVESGAGEWTATGFWHQVDVNSSPYPQARSLPRSWWYGRDATGNYDNGAANAGALTSPFVHIPTGGYYLRFWSWYETETHGGAWDTRRVQISANGGPFADVLQLAGDPMREWIPSPVIDLSPYAGSVIQFRLVFDTVDGLYNDYRGWYVDDFSITATPPMTCSNANEPNNWSGAATSIAYGGSIDAQICPQGDLDYYRFSGAADDRIVVDIDATVNGSLLDSYVFLLDSDGNAVLAQNDDEPTSLDSKLGYQLPHNGTYYVKVRAWAHPLVGGSDYFYTIRLLKDDTNPSVDFTSPADDAWLPSGPITVTVSAIDTGSGVRNVDFFWHSADWSGSDWIWLGSDLDGRDGWSITFDGGGLVEQRGAALFAWVCDWASNCAGDGAWNLGVDRTPPAASISVSPMYGDAPFRDFHVWWDGSDNLSGIARYDVQVRNGVSGAWLELLTDTPDTYYRFVGENGHTYYFRVRARDFAGNQSAYTTGDTQRTVEICPAAADAYERDNTYSSARSIEINSVWQTHNIHAQYDRDWARFTAFPGITYTIVTTNTGRHADTVVYLYEGDGTTLIASNDDDPENWPASRLQWQATTGGPYYIRVEHWDPYAYGCTTQYGLAVTASPSKPIHNVFLPVVMRNERAAQVVYSTDFEGTVGPEWSHTSTETTPVGARRFLGRFGNDTVNLTLAGLPSHTDVTVSFDLYLIDSWDGSGTDSSGNIVTTHGPDVWDLSVVGGPTLLHTTFSNLDEYDWWQAYPGAYPGANNPPLTGAAEVDTLGYTYYGNSVYRLRFTFPHSASSLELTFSASGLYGLFDESWGIDNVEVRVTE